MRIFRRDAALDRHPLEPDRRLQTDCHFRTIHRIAFSNKNLCLHDIHIGNHFRDRMFHLHTGIHFNEIEMFFILIHKKLHRPCIEVIDILHQLDGSITDIITQLLRKRPGRRHFNNFLMAALDRAVTFKQMNNMSRFITENLYLDVLRIHDTFFHIHLIAAESHFRFRLRAVIRLLQIFHAVHIPHTPSAAAIDRFNHDRETVFLGKSSDLIKAFHSTVCAGNHGNLRLFRLDTGIYLVTEHDQMFHTRPDENKSFFLTAFRQLRIFRKKSVAGMDSIHMMLLTDTDNILYIQVSINRLISFPYQVRFISTVPVKRQYILFGINSHRPDAQLIAGTEHTDSDLAPVSYQDLLDFPHKQLPLCVDCILSDKNGIYIFYCTQRRCTFQ